MDRLSPQVAKMAANRLFRWHLDQAKLEVGQLRKTIRRLIATGVPQSELMHILESDAWHLELAACMSTCLKGEA